MFNWVVKAQHIKPPHTKTRRVERVMNGPCRAQTAREAASEAANFRDREAGAAASVRDGPPWPHRRWAFACAITQNPTPGEVPQTSFCNVRQEILRAHSRQ